MAVTSYDRKEEEVLLRSAHLTKPAFLFQSVGKLISEGAPPEGREERVEPTLLPPRESLLGEPRKTASLLFMSIGAQAQFSFDIRGAGSRSLEEKVGIRGLQISVRFWPKSERRKSQKRTDRSLFISKANGTEWPSIRPVVLGNGYKWALASMMMFGMP